MKARCKITPTRRRLMIEIAKGRVPSTPQDERTFAELREFGLAADGERGPELTPLGERALSAAMRPVGAPVPHDPYLHIDREVPDVPGVYVIRQGSDGPIKIGTAKNMRKRVRDLQVGSGFPLRVLKTFAGSYREEARLHGHFRAFRMHGDWFAPAPFVLSSILAANSFAEVFGGREGTEGDR